MDALNLYIWGRVTRTAIIALELADPSTFSVDPDYYVEARDMGEENAVGTSGF